MAGMGANPTMSASNHRKSGTAAIKTLGRRKDRLKKVSWKSLLIASAPAKSGGARCVLIN
jgi:hypothetical protein